LSKNTQPRETAPPPFKASDLGHFRLLREFGEALAKAQAEVQAHPGFHDARRKLELGDCLGLILFGLPIPLPNPARPEPLLEIPEGAQGQQFTFRTLLVCDPRYNSKFPT
jgi:hypothetical protein